MNLDKCSCTGNNLDKLIQPMILTILAQEDLYGYRIVQRIAEKPMSGGQKPDGTGVYRSLKLLEKRGLVASSWNLSDSGPAKRFYKLTEAGLECLLRWIASLEVYRQAIGALLDEAYQACVKARSTAGNDQT
jgi:PadR family transcriptional regulator PadR